MAQFILVDGSMQDFVSSQPNGFTLKELQDRVGGNIETVSIPIEGKIMIVNEDGHSLHLAPNPVASLTAGQLIVGTAVIMDHSEWFDDYGGDDEEDDDCGHDTDCWDDEDDFDDNGPSSNLPNVHVEDDLPF